MKRAKFVKTGMFLMVMGCLSVRTVHADETTSAMSTDMTTSTTTVNGHPGRMWTQTIHVTATVVAIDKAKRSLSLQGPDGSIVDLTVNESVKRFDAINVGDKVSAAYLESMALYVQKPGDVPAVSGDSSYIVSAKGTMPKGVAVQSQQITATVTKINYKTREVTLQGPQGHSQTLVAGPEIKRFNEVKVGDQVVANYTLAVAISVNKAS